MTGDEIVGCLNLAALGTEWSHYQARGIDADSARAVLESRRRCARRRNPPVGEPRGEVDGARSSFWRAQGLMKWIAACSGPI